MSPTEVFPYQQFTTIIKSTTYVFINISLSFLQLIYYYFNSFVNSIFVITEFRPDESFFVMVPSYFAISSVQVKPWPSRMISNEELKFWPWISRMSEIARFIYTTDYLDYFGDALFTSWTSTRNNGICKAWKSR